MKVSCGGCDVTWTGVEMLHCSLCHQSFTAIHNFDLHRNKKTGACKTPVSLGFVRNAYDSAWMTPRT